MVICISESEFAINKCLAFGCSSSAGIYSNLANASADIFRAEGIGPVSKWIDNFVFFQIPTAQVHHYNQLCQAYQNIITSNGGPLREEGCLWFRGSEWLDRSHEEFDDSCQHPIKILTPDIFTSDPDSSFAYTLKHIDTISKKLSIPWEQSKDQPFSSSFTYLGFHWDINNKQVTLIDHK